MTVSGNYLLHFAIFADLPNCFFVCISVVSAIDQSRQRIRNCRGRGRRPLGCCLCGRRFGRLANNVAPKRDEERNQGGVYGRLFHRYFSFMRRECRFPSTGNIPGISFLFQESHSFDRLLRRLRNLNSFHPQALDENGRKCAILIMANFRLQPDIITPACGITSIIFSH